MTRNNIMNGLKSIDTSLGMISLPYYSLMNHFSKKITTVVRSWYSDIKRRKKSMHHRIFKGKKKVQNYRRWYEDALSVISLVRLFLLMVRSMEIPIFSCLSKTSYHSFTSFEKMVSIMLSFSKTMLLLIVQKRP